MQGSMIMKNGKISLINEQSNKFILFIIFKVTTLKMLQEFESIYSKIKMSENLNIKEQDGRSRNQQQLKEQIIKTLTDSQEQSIINKKTSIFKQDKPPGYRVLQESQNELLCLKDGQSRIYLSLLINSNAQLQKIINFYIQQKQWNGFISEQLIQQDQEQNNLQIYREFKKMSFFSKERATFTKMKVVCTKNSAIIIQDNIESSQIPLQSQRIICKIKIISKFYRCLRGIKLIMDAQFDAKGFCSIKDSLSMLLKLTNDLKYFENSFKILQLQKRKINTLIYSSVNESTHKMLKKQNIEQKSQKSQISQKEIKFIKQSKEKQSTARFIQIKPKNPLDIPTSQYISMFTSGYNQKYFLRSAFHQQNLQEYDNYTPSYNFETLIQSGKQYVIKQNNQLQYINYEMINGQKQSLKFIIKQIGSNILSGKSAFNVSMPVDIFQSRTLLQRSATSFGCTPSYLCPVASEDILTQMKNVVTFIVTIPTMELFMQKPFNPILGQTFQAYIKGIPISYEQISHHPPISAFYMKCDQFTMYGNLIAFADIGLNSAVGGNEGLLSIKFKNGSHFQCYFPPCEISGLIFGKRTFRPYGRGFFFEQKSRIFAEVNLGGFKKGLYDKQQQKITQAHLFGGIFKVKKQFIQQLKTRKPIRKFSGISKEDVQEKLASIKGIWFKQIIIDGKIMNKDVKPYPIQYPTINLPSDANFREDVLYHKTNNLEESQKQKQVLQNKQRADRKLRQKYMKILKKK